MKYKIIFLTFLIGVIILCLPSYKETYQKIEPIQIKEVKKVAVYRVVKEIYKEPAGEVKELIEYVARETSVPVETLNKIVWAESRYNLQAKNINTNKSVDTGIFQINSQHIPLAKSMGIDIHTPKGNADMAIYLIQKNGLSDWGASQKVLNSI